MVCTSPALAFGSTKPPKYIDTPGSGASVGRAPGTEMRYTTIRLAPKVWVTWPFPLPPLSTNFTVCGPFAMRTPVALSKWRNLRTSATYTRKSPFGFVPPLLQQPKVLGLLTTLPVISQVSNHPLADDGEVLVSRLCQRRNAAMGSAGSAPGAAHAASSVVLGPGPPVVQGTPVIVIVLLAYPSTPCPLRPTPAT